MEKKKSNYITSVKVAKIIKFDHDKLMNIIKGFIKNLKRNAENPRLYFDYGACENGLPIGQNSIINCYLITECGCDFLSKTLYGIDKTAFVVQYMNHFYGTPEERAEERRKEAEAAKARELENLKEIAKTEDIDIPVCKRNEDMIMEEVTDKNIDVGSLHQTSSETFFKNTFKNDLMIIAEQEVLGKNFKIYGTLENPLFKAIDVAEWIEHSKVSMMLNSVDVDEKVKVSNVYSDGRTGGNGTWFLTEDGLYEVLMQSRKPIARQFKKQVKELLKQLRKSGGHISNSDRFIDTYFGDMAEEQKGIMRSLLYSVEEKQKKIKKLEDENEEMKPKALFYDTVGDYKDAITVGDMAAILSVENGVKIGSKKLFEYFRDKKYLCSASYAWNKPSARMIVDEYFVYKEYAGKHGEITFSPRITGKGQQFVQKMVHKDIEYFKKSND